MNKMKVAAIGAAVWLMAGSAAFAEVQISIQEGRVTLVAKDATVRQILAEWARVGQTTIVNLDRIPGGPVTLELNSVPEPQALDVLLRSLSGYMAAPRPQAAANLSQYDRIVVMPTSAPPRAPVSAAAAPAPAFSQPQFVQPQFQPPQPADDDDDDKPAPNVPAPNPRGPVFNTFPAQPQVVNPQAPPPSPFNPQQPQTPGQQPPAQTPNVPFGGVAVPGMVVQPPQQQQPGQQPMVVPGQPPVAPGQQPRRPGGPEND
jgi:hypothetical protein